MKTKHFFCSNYIVCLISISVFYSNVVAENKIPVITHSGPRSDLFFNPFIYTTYRYIIDVEDDDPTIHFSVIKKPTWLNVDSTQFIYPKHLLLKGRAEELVDDSLVVAISDSIHTIYHREYLRVYPVLIPPDFVFVAKPKTEIIVGENFLFEGYVLNHDVDNEILSLECTKKPDWLTYEQIPPVYSDRIEGKLTGTPAQEGDYEVLFEMFLNLRTGVIKSSYVYYPFTIHVKKGDMGINETTTNRNLILSQTSSNIYFREVLTNIEIFNTMGSSISSYKNTSCINISSLSKGIYLFKLKDSNNVSHQFKFIKKQ